MWWKLVVAIHDLLVDSERIVIIERWISSEHFENKNPEGPPVNIFVMSFGLDDFRRKIFRCTAKSHGFISYDFCKTKVSNFDMSLFVDKEVFWFEISVGYVHGVEIVKSEYDFCCKEERNVV